MLAGIPEKNEGEGNRSADRRYRRGVRETVEELDLDDEDNSSHEHPASEEKSQ